ncbi:MAG: hypothetical protein RIB32_03790 [Phycisphaerales bacterium]
MPFERGQVSFARFSHAAGVSHVGAEQLDALGESAFRATEIGAPPEVESGWVTGKHLNDTAFDQEKCAFLDDEVGHFALRIDTNRVPAELKRAIRAEHEAAVLEDSGASFLSRGMKREVKELIDAALQNELSTGRHRRSRLTPVLWRPGVRRVLAASGAANVAECLRDRWRSTFEQPLEGVSAGRLAWEIVSERGRTREFEDARPTAFIAAPGSYVPRGDEEGGAWEANASVPPIPWALSGPEPRDFFGNEFLLWLWHATEVGRGEIEANGERYAVVLDGALEMACAWGVSGTMTLKSEIGETAPSRQAEAYEGLLSGKLPRRAGLTLAEGEDVWRLTLQADRWLVTGCALPELEEKFETPRQLVEWRFEQVLRVDAALEALFAAFLDERLSSRWEQTRKSIRQWIQQRRKGATAMVEVKQPAPEAAATAG